jgi:hypothetical protein
MAEWRPVDDWSGYEVSDDGNVRSWKVSRQTPTATLPRLISRWVLPNGYVCVTLKDKGRRVNLYVHRMVARAFLGPCPTGQEVAHGDGERLNNTLANLRYVTPKENSADTLAHGHRPVGERHYAALLTNEQAAELRAFPGTHAEAARAFGLRYHAAYCIRTGRSWRRA